MWVLRWWALPSAGAWLAAAMILYSCRVLERRTGSNKFVVSDPSCARGLDSGLKMDSISITRGHRLRANYLGWIGNTSCTEDDACTICIIRDDVSLKYLSSVHFRVKVPIYHMLF